MKEEFIKIDNNHFIGIDYPSKNGDYGCKSYIKLEEDGTFWQKKQNILEKIMKFENLRNESGLKFTDISSEKYRIYIFKNNKSTENK